MGAELQTALKEQGSNMAIKRALRSQKARSVRRSGILKAQQGKTTVEEVLRVTT